MAARTLLLSIRPKFAHKIFMGEKTMELRRTRPNVQAGDWALVYVSSPRKAIFGAFEIADLIESSPEGLWSKAELSAAVTAEQYADYLIGAHRAFGICIRRVKRFVRPVSLAELRLHIPGFHPPQSYRYLTSMEMDRAGIESPGCGSSLFNGTIAA